MVLAAAVGASVIGGVVWSNVVADDRTAVDDEVTLVEPGEYVEPGTATNPPVNRRALPMVPLTDAAGVVFDPAADDRPMVVNLWFSTCPPCARELIEFGELDRELGDQVRFVGVNPSDDAERMTEFAAARDVDYELYLDEDGAFTDELGIVAFPVTLLVAPDGTIVEQAGALTGRELRERLAEHWGVG
jgi:thiol-disulfide isomerase/thioredoxin